ncbi:MAG: type II toxin-antitoxin system PemK/MazF family toxin [Caldilineaceae bacterium]
MKPGDIVLVRFPQTDLQNGKLRPALVVAYIPGSHPDILLALITSREYQAIANFDEIIEPSDRDFLSTGLKARSVVRLTRLATVEVSVINAQLGMISQSRLTRIRNRLSDWLRMS